MTANKPPYASASVRDHVLVIKILLKEIRDPKVSYGLRDEISSLFNSAEVRHVVVDLGQVTFMGSIGLLALLAVRRSVAPGRMVICNLSKAIREMLELCLLVSNDPAKTAPFEAVPTLDEALARLTE